MPNDIPQVNPSLQDFQQIDLSTLGNASVALVPQLDAASVEQSIRSFHRLSGGGPSGLRPIHLKNCLLGCACMCIHFVFFLLKVSFHLIIQKARKLKGK